MSSRPVHFPRRAFVLLLALLTPLLLQAQTATGGRTLVGKVYDDQLKEWLSSAAVRVTDAAGTKLLKGAITNTQGRFSLSGLPEGELRVEISFVGYDTFTKSISAKERSRIDLGTIHLTPSATALSEVQVVGQANPVTMKTDTVQFNAGAFKVREGGSVEELLRQIPGVEVDSDGSITYNGEAIEKVELDGRDFFSSDPALATKNLPASMIRNIQVVDKKSEQTRLTGMDDGEKVKVLNLNVKEELKKGFLGHLKGGYGTRERYRGDLMASYFRGDARYTLLGNLNNTDGVRRGRGDLDRRSAGANYDNKFGSKLHVTSELYYRDDERELPSRVHRENILGDTAGATVEDRSSRSLSRGRSLSYDGRLEWTPTERTALFFMPDISLQSNRQEDYGDFTTADSSGAKINGGESEQLSDDRSANFGGTLHFRHTFDDRGRNIYARLYGRADRSGSEGTLKSTTDFAKRGEKQVIDQQTTSDLRSGSGGLSLSYLEPFTDRWSLQLTYSLSAQDRSSDRLAYNADAQGDYTLLDKTYSRGSHNKYVNQRIGARARYTFGERSNVSFGFDALPTRTHTITTDGEEVTFDRTRSIVNYAPSLMLDLRQGKGLQMMLQYRGQTDQPSMDQLNPVVVQTSPLSRTEGNPGLAPSFRHMVFTRAFYNDVERQRHYELFGFFNATNNAVITRRTLDRETGISSTTYENVNGLLSFNFGGSATLPFAKHWTSFTNARMGLNRSKAYVNDRLNAATNTTAFLIERLTWSGEYLQASVGAAGNVSRLRNSVAGTGDRCTIDYRFFNDLTWNAPFGLSLSHRITYSDAAGYTDDIHRRLWIWNLSLGYSFLKDRRATVELSAEDLLGQRNNFRRTSTAQGITDTLYEGVTSYVMVTVTYKFNTLGGGVTADSGRGWGRRGGFGPGGRRGLRG